MMEYTAGFENLNVDSLLGSQDGMGTEGTGLNEGLQPTAYEGLDELEQVEKMADYLEGIDEIKYENWEKLSLDERLNVMQDIENKAAEIGGRIPLQVRGVQLGNPQGQLFSAGRMVWENQSLEMNVDLLNQDSMQALNTCLDTVLHEGRHAYQWSNMMVRRTERSNEKFNAWCMNLNTGYLPCEQFGFERYSMQPVELDARLFSEEVRSKLTYR